GRSAKFTKRLTKKEKDSVRIVANGGTEKKESGYDHDSKETLKKAAKALGAKATLKSGGVKTTLGPAGGLTGGFGSVTTTSATPTVLPQSDIKTTFGLLAKSIKQSVSGGMDLDLPVNTKTKTEKKEYVTANLPDYVDLMNSRNPKKLVQRKLAQTANLKKK
ncbi:hypothetical protein BCR33DRAFT_718621, partial [Rhizoclosmatium globosum]